MLDSVKLRRPLTSASVSPAVEEDELEINRDQPWIQPPGGAPLPCVFAFSERRRTLHVFADQGEACRRIDPREVAQAAWAFFNGDGQALGATFVIPNEDPVRGKAGTYVLSLKYAAVLHCSDASVQFDSIAQIRLHLKRRAAGASGLVKVTG